MAQYATTLEEVLALRSETARMRRALEKIRKAYVDAPGMAAPIPTTELIWKMYSLAGDGLAVTNGQENTDG